MRPAIATLRVLPDRVVATDSYQLVEVTRPKTTMPPVSFSSSSFPVLRKAMGKKTEHVCIDQDAAMDEKNPVVGVSIMENSASVANVLLCKEPGNFPAYDSIMPKGKPKAASKVQAKYLLNLAKYLKKHAKNGHCTVELHDMNDGRNTLFTVKAETTAGNQATALIMPLRFTEEEQEYYKTEEPKPTPANTRLLEAVKSLLAQTNGEAATAQDFNSRLEGWDSDDVFVELLEAYQEATGTL